MVGLIVAVAFAAPFLALAGYVLYCRAQEYRPDRVPALLYHRLMPRAEAHLISDSDRSYVVTAEAFAEQMAYLDHSGYTTLSLDELTDYMDGTGALPKKPVVITFDDGFASNYRYAFPVLHKHAMKATIFMTPDRESANFKKHAALDVALTDEQLRDLDQNGVSIESHGMTHRYLTELDAGTAQWELAASKSALEGVLGKKIKYLAIPSGAYNRKLRRLAIETGHRAVFCMLKGTNNKGSDRFALRRLVVGRDMDIEDFARALQPATAFRIRIAGDLQNLLARALGPAGLDRLRNNLYHSCLGRRAAHAHRYVIPGLAAVVVSALAGLAWLVGLAR
jgi:peptidoglycan/xylan/chitin deacetylase (PgdA/CDA1 family)